MAKSYLFLSVVCALFLLSRAQVEPPYNNEEESIIEIIPVNPPYNEEEPVVPPYTNEEEPVVPPYTNEEEAVVPPYTNEEEPVVPPYVNEEQIVVIPIYGSEEEPVVPPYTNEEEPVVPPYNNEEPVVPPYTNEEEPVVPPYTNEEEPVMPPYVGEQTPFPPYVNEEEELFNLAPPLDGAVSVKSSGDKYACPKGYTYLSYDDANNFSEETCAAYQPDSTYRLLGGGSASGSNKICQTNPMDPKLYLKAVCVKTEIEEIRGVNGDQCPPGTARASLEEVEAHQDKFCSAIGQWDIARIAFMGSMDGSGYNCNSRDYDARQLGPILCVRRKILDIQLKDSCENICGKGLSLLTVQEALDSQDYYCSLLAPDAIVRLAGGGSMDGSQYGCKIRDTDRRRLGDALCANKRG